MASEWLEILKGPEAEFAVPQLSITRGSNLSFKGSGRVHWTPDKGIRVLASTDGAEHMAAHLGELINAIAGRVIPRDKYFSVQGTTQDGWALSAVPVPQENHTSHYASPFVTWDLATPGLTLSRPQGEGDVRERRLLQGLLGPSPTTWRRWTWRLLQTEGDEERQAERDWLCAKLPFGRLTARKYSDEWFQFRLWIDPNSTSPIPPDGQDILLGIQHAFSFVLGRNIVCRGFEDLHETRDERHLFVPRGPSRGTTPAPLGEGGTYFNHVESLLALAVPFFMTAKGRIVAQQLSLCWDSADNQWATQLAVASVCLEPLLRLCPEAAVDSGCNDDDRAALAAWIDSQEGALSDRFLKRVRGFQRGLDNRRPIDTLWNWARRGILGVSGIDIASWEAVRHPAAHGNLAEKIETRTERQALFDHYYRVFNLINRVVLGLIGYQGTYLDYAQPGFRAATFSGFESVVSD